MSNEQATRPAFKVGQVWETNDGHKAFILKIDVAFEYPILAYTEYGKMFCRRDGTVFSSGPRDQSEFDLSRLIIDVDVSEADLAPKPAPPAEPWPLPRLFAAPIRRTFLASGGMVLDAIADDGTAWQMFFSLAPEIEDPAPYWRQLPPLPQPEAE